MSIYLDEKNPSRHKPFQDASPDIVDYVRYLEVIAGKSANTAFNYYCDLRNFSRFMKQRRGLVPEDAEMKDIDPKGLDTAFWGSVSKEDIYEYLYFLNQTCGNKKSSTARRLASLHGFYDYMVNHASRLEQDPTAAVSPPKLDKVLPKYLTADQARALLEATRTSSDFPERDYCMAVLFLNCGMRLSELVGMDCNDIGTETVRIIGKGNKERLVYLNDACHFALKQYIDSRAALPNLQDKNALFVSRKTGRRISARRVQQIVSQALQTAGLGGKGYSTHKLRHTAATLMYRFGKVDMLALKEILGHEHVSTTEIYTHISTEQLRNAAKASPLSGIKFTHPEDEPARNKPAGSEEPCQEEEKQEENRPQSPEAE